MPTPWNEDPAGAAPRIRRNLEGLLRKLLAEAPSRVAPSVDLAREWHRSIFRGVDLPVPYFAGEVRDDDADFPELIGYEVRVGALAGTDSRFVPEELERFEARMRRAVGLLDPQVAVGDRPRTTGVLGSVVTLCGTAHGEWVRIHPFANGNGRTARLWANWCAVRYGLPPFVRLQPRPEGDLYGRAARDSMAGNHRAIVSLLADWLAERYRETA